MQRTNERRPRQGYDARNEVDTSKRILSKHFDKVMIAMTGIIGLAIVIASQCADTTTCLVIAYCGMLIGYALGLWSAPQNRAR